jgi:hypothetical protein
MRSMLTVPLFVCSHGGDEVQPAQVQPRTFPPSAMQTRQTHALASTDLIHQSSHPRIAPHTGYNHHASSTALRRPITSAPTRKPPTSRPHTLPLRFHHHTTQRHQTRRTLENTHIRLVAREPDPAAKRWGGAHGAAPRPRLTAVRALSHQFTEITGTCKRTP